MAFALSIVNLEEALKKPGCPVCRLEHDAAIRSMDAFLWENTNDPQVRKPINDAYGFCPEHTQLLVAKERMTSGPVLGVNMIYALLAKNVSQDLKKIQHQKPTHSNNQTWLSLLVERLHLPHKAELLTPTARCPVCLLMEESAQNILATLFEVLTTEATHFFKAYQGSDGLCLRHLRLGLEQQRSMHPAAADLLINDTIRRLEAQQGEMQEYLRKHNWQYRDEKMTAEEQTAWLHTLTFFTGLPASRFDHKIEEF